MIETLPTDLCVMYIHKFNHVSYLGKKVPVYQPYNFNE